MIVDLKHYEERFAAQVVDLYQSVGWTNYTDHPARITQGCARSLYTLTAWDNDALVGLIRAVGDGVSIVYAQDLLVRPDHQRKGIGTLLLRALMEQYREVYQLVLLTDAQPKTIAFYKSLGLTQITDFGCTAFMRGL